MPKKQQEALIRVKKNFQLTLPGSIRKQSNISEGDYIKIKTDNKGGFTLKPVKVIDPDQAYFWTEEWQKMEREADDDLKNGRIYGPAKRLKEIKKILRTTKV